MIIHFLLDSSPVTTHLFKIGTCGSICGIVSVMYVAFHCAQAREKKSLKLIQQENVCFQGKIMHGTTRPAVLNNAVIKLRQFKFL